MGKAKELEADFKMYSGAVRDLKENGGDPRVIQNLTEKKARVGQALNMIAGPCITGKKQRLSFV